MIHRPVKAILGMVLGAAWLLAAGLAQATLPIQHWTTSSGARVFFVRADAIPMLDLSVEFDAGSRFDPPGRSGLAALTNAMLPGGVAGENPLDEAGIAEGFARIGAQRGGGASDDRASVSLRTLASEPELGQAVDLIARLLSSPAFAQPVLERERERSIQAIREAATKPAAIANRAFAELLYPAHPYGVEPTEASVAAITREDLVRFHRDHYDAGRAVVAMIGAVTRERAETIAEQLTRNLPRGTDRPALPPVAMPVSAAQRRIAHPASQSHILVGMPAIARGDPDFFALMVGNYVLGGGGFVSRLYSEVREKRGLAYSVYSYFSPQLQPGPFTIGLQTQKAQTDQALEVVREVLARFVSEGPIEAELQAAKSNLIGGFALRIDSNRKILDHLAAIGYYRLPLDYLDRWTDRVGEVTLEQVRQAFARRIRPDSLVTVVVGDGPAPGSGATAR